jgi:hypothetical protein
VANIGKHLLTDCDDKCHRSSLGAASASARLGLRNQALGSESCGIRQGDQERVARAIHEKMHLKTTM